jgi:3',5'-cyclic AMP phosphodiesterase CpdA
VDLGNGSVTFCRFTRRGNVGELYVIADNHDPRGAHSGSYTVRGQTTCPSRRSVTRTTAPA